MLKLEAADTFVLAAKPVSPAKSVLGDLDVRKCLLVRVRDTDGCQGWGEVWCNFPPSAAEHRRALIEDVVFPSIKGKAFSTPSELSKYLAKRWRVLAHHTGEVGPFTNVIAGLDIAAWDLSARKRHLQLRELCGKIGSEYVRVYASSPNPDNIIDRIEDLLCKGHTAVKLKVGYGDEEDLNLVKIVRSVLGHELELFVDANQSWTREQAAKLIRNLEAYRIGFVEEPIPAFTSLKEWGRLAGEIEVDIAGGENIPDTRVLKTYIDENAIQVFQPSITKFGGVTGWLEMASMATKAGRRLMPHFMGGAPGLAVTLQLTSLFECADRVELDANDNPLRTEIGPIDLAVSDGRVVVPDGPGLGFRIDPMDLKPFLL